MSENFKQMGAEHAGLTVVNITCYQLSSTANRQTRLQHSLISGFADALLAEHAIAQVSSKRLLRAASSFAIEAVNRPGFSAVCCLALKEPTSNEEVQGLSVTRMAQ